MPTARVPESTNLCQLRLRCTADAYGGKPAGQGLNLTFFVSPTAILGHFMPLEAAGGSESLNGTFLIILPKVLKSTRTGSNVANRA